MTWSIIVGYNVNSPEQTGAAAVGLPAASTQ
jgi:hypothetical protein